MIAADVEETVAQLIDSFDLHGTTERPVHRVNLAPLEEWFPITRRPLRALGLAGYVLAADHPVSAERSINIVLASELTAYRTRLAYAHEIGHALHGHEGATLFDNLDSWFTDRFEREAWRVAAQLLVPVDAIATYQTVQAISQACDVPEKLVRLT